VFVTLPGPPFFSLENKGKAKTEGLEVSGHLGPWKGVKLASSYTFLDSRDDAGAALLRRPRHKGNVTVTYVRDRLSLFTEVNYVGGQRDTFDFVGADGRVRAGALPRYHTVSLSGTYDLFRDRGPVKKLQIFARAENLFDTTYEEIKGFPAAGVTAFAGVRVFLF
ncbi:MAG: TonB-dependent receptor domain-containing protein, partial [Myxococcota bacterium]